MSRTKVFLCLFIFCNITLVIAQKVKVQNALKFKHFSTNEGLSQSSVISILQDNDGFLWFGTRYGLNKYDGNVFVNYTNNPEDSNSISHNKITALTKDYNGTIWVGTGNGLNKYNPEEDNFKRIKEAGTKEYYNREISALKIQDSTYLWIGTKKGLDRLNINNKTFLSYTHNLNKKKSIGSNYIMSLLNDNEGNLWASNSETIDLFQQEKNTFIHFNYPNDLSPNQTKSNVNKLFQDKKGNIWLGYNKGLAIFNRELNVFEDFLFEGEIYQSLINHEVRDILEDELGNLWLGSYAGLFYLDFKKKRVNKYKHDETDINSLSQNSVYKICEDSRGDLWIGTWAGGLNYLDKNANKFINHSVAINNKGINYKVVSSIREDKEGNLLIGTEGGGVNYYFRDKGVFKYLLHEPKFPNILSVNNVKAIMEDCAGDFWIGTHGGGLNLLRVNPNTKEYEKFDKALKDNVSLRNNKITSLEEDNQCRIWVGTNHGGLNVLDKISGKFIRIKDNNVLGDFIYTILKSRYGNYLYVGSEKGLAIIDVLTREITPINLKEKKQNNIVINEVISIYEESSTSLWVGTEGKGLYNYQLDSKKSKHYGVAEGLSNQVIYGILPDDNDNIWLSTNRGLFRFNTKTDNFKNFDKVDGIQGNEFNYGAYLRTNKGELIFGGTDGLTIINPNEITKDVFVPPIKITSLNLWNQGNINITNFTKEITLKYKQNDFSINFVALGYSQPKKMEYAYKLMGFNDKWKVVGNNKVATYTNLNPGKYEFHVKASNSDGIWTTTPATIKLEILPPLWRTWWAYLIYLVLSISLLLAIRKYSLIRINDKNQLRQERLAKEKIEQENKFKLQLFTNISHDFRTPLTLIVGPLRRILNKKDVDPLLHKQLNSMYRNASILLQLINQLLDFRKSEAGKLKLFASKGNIIPFLENLKLAFEDLAEEKKINYSFVYKEECIKLWFSKIEMKKVIMNVLANAFKFTPTEGQISLEVSVLEKENRNSSSSFAQILIRDSGKGIPEENIDFVFDRYFQLGQKNELRSGTGVGLALAKDIVTLHHGTIKAESSKEQGTIFTILLPMGKDHLNSTEIVDGSFDEENDESLGHFETTNLKIGWTKEQLPIKSVIIDDDLPSVLIVEDNQEVRNFVKEIFDAGFNVFEAINGEKGIQAAETNPIDIIISDIMMPKMDGVEMSKILKLNIKTSHIPIVLLTARTSSKIQKIGYETGADAYVTKPFDADLLKLQVENLLKSRRKLVAKFKKDILIEPKELTVVSTDEIFLKNAMQIIEENISDSDFNVNSFTDKMHMSQSVLYRKIKVLTGQSLSEFIRTVRLKRASQLLVQTERTVSDIAYDIGFNDLKYFRRCFKLVFKKTPSEYRKINKKE